MTAPVGQDVPTGGPKSPTTPAASASSDSDLNGGRETAPKVATQQDETRPNQTPHTAHQEKGPLNTADTRSERPERPITPPAGIPRADHLQVPTTPRMARPPEVPTTPSSSARDYSSASAYLSSPVRSTRSNIPLAGTMTPGRPSLKFNPPPSPFRATRPLGGPSNSHSGQLNLKSPVSLPILPVQTFLMTKDQAMEISDLDTARTALVKALEQSEQYHNSAQQFRNLASQQIFQHKLLQVESDESERRFEVENSIQKREIEKLVVDIMGYDKTASTDQIRKRLKKTKHRVREMSELLEAKDREIETLRQALNQHAQPQISQVAQVPPVPHGPVQLPVGSYVLPGSIPVYPYQANYHQSEDSEMTMGTESSTPTPTASQSELHSSPEKPKPPPIDTRSVSQQFSQSQQLPGPLSTTSTDTNLSDLELLASQTLINGFQQAKPPALSAPASAHPAAGYGTSPHSSPFYAPFSPYAVPPQQPRQLHFGSPEKRRRPSSSSTISQGSEDDTLEEPNTTNSA